MSPLTLLAGIGHTPLIKLSTLPGLAEGRAVYAKLEGSNPGGSIKDRAVSYMLQQAERDGIFVRGRRLLDSSSGNAGISYAMLGAALNIPVTVVVPENASPERLARIRAHGAELLLTDAIEGYDHAIYTARTLAQEQPDRYWYCDQYSNDNNWRAHYNNTGPEIIQQLHTNNLTAEAFVSGIGTGGTITGVGKRLREVFPDMRIATLKPDLFPGIEGLKPLDDGDIIPAILDQTLIDERIPVTSESAQGMCLELARQGLFVGPSSGANVCAAVQMAEQQDLHSIITILPDMGERYHSTGMWSSDGV